MESQSNSTADANDKAWAKERAARERQLGKVLAMKAGLNGVEVGGKAFFALGTALPNPQFATFVMAKKPTNA